MLHHLFLSIFGVEIELETDYPEIIWMVQNLYEHFLVSTPFKNPSVRIRFLSNGEQTATSFGNKVHLFDVETPLVTCLSALWQATVSRLQDCDVFHGASVAHGEGSILMLGDPESGKTTLTLGLLREGKGKFSFLAEDVSFVDLRSREIVPFPRAFTVTEQTLKLFPELSSIPERIYGKHAMKRIVSIREVLNTFSVNIGKPSALSYILLLEAGEDFQGPAKLEHLEPTRSVLELCKRSLSIHSGVVRSIDIARDLVSRAKRLRLRVGELDNTVKTVIDLVSE